MKKENYTIGILCLAFMSFLIVGCNKDEGSEAEEFQQLAFNSEEVLDMLPVGLTNSSDTYAQFCVSYITTAVDMSSFIGSMEVPPDAQQSTKKSTSGGDTWQWTWSYGGRSFTIFWTFEEDQSKRYWSMDIQYGSAQVFDYVDAWEYKDGSGGEVVYNFNWVGAYDDMSEDVGALNWIYSWTKNGAGDYAIKWFWESENMEYSYDAKYDILIKANGSGSLESFMEDIKVLLMEWDIMGNGTWTMGETGESGSWTAG